MAAIPLSEFHRQYANFIMVQGTWVPLGLARDHGRPFPLDRVGHPGQFWS